MSVKNVVWKVLNGFQSYSLVHWKLRNYILRSAGCSIDESSIIGAGVFVGSNLLKIKEKVFINIGVFLDGNAEIYIGEYARIGPYVRILTGSHRYANSVLRRGPKSTEDINLPVIIERGCWLGMGVMVMPGVRISEGCVIAAGAVVDKSTSPNGLYAGIPAKRIKDLSVDDDE